MRMMRARARPSWVRACSTPFVGRIESALIVVLGQGLVGLLDPVGDTVDDDGEKGSHAADVDGRFGVPAGDLGGRGLELVELEFVDEDLNGVVGAVDDDRVGFRHVARGIVADGPVHDACSRDCVRLKAGEFTIAYLPRPWTAQVACVTRS